MKVVCNNVNFEFKDSSLKEEFPDDAEYTIDIVDVGVMEEYHAFVNGTISHYLSLTSLITQNICVTDTFSYQSTISSHLKDPPHRISLVLPSYH